MSTENNNSLITNFYSGKFAEFLSPDSHPYNGSINSLFSYEFELGEELRESSLRDGVLPLMRFFAINKLPDENGPVLTIDSTLSSLVPQAWRSKILLRTPFVKDRKVTNKKVFVFLSPDPKNIPHEILKNEMEILRSHLGKDDELVLFFSSLRMRGEGRAFSDHAYGYKIFLTFLQYFKGRKISVISLADFLKEDLEGSRFHFINPLNFYFTDSFLFHEVARRGSSPVFKMPVDEEELKLSISPDHGFKIHRRFEDYVGANGPYDEVQERLFSSVPTYAQTKDIQNLHDKFYPKSFVDWAYDVALDLYRKRVPKM